MMQLNESNFQMAVKFGAVALAVSVLANIYLVMRYREVYRDLVHGELQFQQLLLQQQSIEGVLREFLPRAATDPKVAEILQRHQILARPAPPASHSQEQGAKP